MAAFPPMEELPIIIASGTFASVTAAYPAANYSGSVVSLTDLNNSLWISDGTNWKPVNGSVVVNSFYNYPVFVLPSGTITASGSAVTFTTSLTQTYTDGFWGYIGTNTSSLTSGFYFFIPSSATAAVMYGTAQSLPNNSPSSTPTVIGGNGTFTGDTNEITCAQFTIPGGLLGTTGIVETDFVCVRNSSGTGSVVFNKKLGSTTIAGITVSTSNQSARGIVEVRNTSAARQIRTGSSFTGYSTLNAGTTVITENTAADLTLSLTADTANALDWAMIPPFSRVRVII